MMRKAMIGAIEVEVGTEEECEKADFVICGPTSFFADDIKASCFFCDATVFHRPYAPKTPPKVCLKCFMEQAQAAEC